MSQRSCDVESLQDFSRYYNGSWVGYTDKIGTVSPALVGRDDGVQISLRLLEKRKDDTYGYGDPLLLDFKELQAKVDFGRPDIGMMEDGPTVVYLSYGTPRQAHKGLRTREIFVDELNTTDIRNLYVLNRPGRSGVERYDWVWRAFKPEFIRYSEAFGLLQDGKKVGVPVSQRIGLYLLPDAAAPLVAYKRWSIGYAADPKTLCIHRKYQDYAEDLVEQTSAEVQYI